MFNKAIKTEKSIIEHYINPYNAFKLISGFVGGMSLPYLIGNPMNLNTAINALYYIVLAIILSVVGYALPVIDGKVNQLIDIWQNIIIRMQTDINKIRTDEKVLQDKIDERIKFYTQKSMDEIEQANK